MKYRFTKTHSYWWPVTVEIPHPEPGQAGTTLSMSFSARFEKVDRDAIEKAGAADREADLKRVVTGWDENVVGDDDRPIPFSAEALAELLGDPWFRLGLYRAWAESLVPGAARRGN